MSTITTPAQWLDMIEAHATCPHLKAMCFELAGMAKGDGSFQLPSDRMKLMAIELGYWRGFPRRVVLDLEKAGAVVRVREARRDASGRKVPIMRVLVMPDDPSQLASLQYPQAEFIPNTEKAA